MRSSSFALASGFSISLVVLACGGRTTPLDGDFVPVTTGGSTALVGGAHVGVGGSTQAGATSGVGGTVSSGGSTLFGGATTTGAGGVAPHGGSTSAQGGAVLIGGSTSSQGGGTSKAGSTSFGGSIGVGGAISFGGTSSGGATMVGECGACLEKSAFQNNCAAQLKECNADASCLPLYNCIAQSCGDQDINGLQACAVQSCASLLTGQQQIGEIENLLTCAACGAENTPGGPTGCAGQFCPQLASLCPTTGPGGPGPGGPGPGGPGGPGGGSTQDVCGSCVGEDLQNGACGTELAQCESTSGCVDMLECLANSGCGDSPNLRACGAKAGCKTFQEQEAFAAAELAIDCGKCDCAGACNTPPGGCATGTGGSGVGGTTGAGGADPGGPACQACEAMAVALCQPEQNACDTDMSCSALEQCFTQCGNDANCENDCFTKIPNGGGQIYQDLAACFLCGACEQLCLPADQQEFCGPTTTTPPNTGGDDPQPGQGD